MSEQTGIDSFVCSLDRERGGTEKERQRERGRDERVRDERVRDESKRSRECLGLGGVIGLTSTSLTGVISIASSCSHDWAAWVAIEGTNSKDEPSATSPTGYGWTLDDPPRGETDKAAELDGNCGRLGFEGSKSR